MGIEPGSPAWKTSKVTIIPLQAVESYWKYNIGIKHGFPCIKICQVPREVLKTEVEDRGF